VRQEAIRIMKSSVFFKGRLKATTFGGRFVSYSIDNLQTLIFFLALNREQVVDGKGQPMQNRFTKANNGVITDSVTGHDWYVGPNHDNNWHQAKAWMENLTVAGGSWRMPTVPELKALY
jgi:hypothetical protein